MMRVLAAASLSGGMELLGVVAVIVARELVRFGGGDAGDAGSEKGVNLRKFGRVEPGC